MKISKGDRVRVKAGYKVRRGTTWFVHSIGENRYGIFVHLSGEPRGMGDYVRYVNPDNLEVLPDREEAPVPVSEGYGIGLYGDGRGGLTTTPPSSPAREEPAGGDWEHWGREEGEGRKECGCGFDWECRRCFGTGYYDPEEGDGPEGEPSPEYPAGRDDLVPF